MDTQLVLLIAKYIFQLVQAGPTIIQDIDDTKPFAEAIVRAVAGKSLTQAEKNALDAKLAELSAELQAPIPED